MSKKKKKIEIEKDYYDMFTPQAIAQRKRDKVGHGQCKAWLRSLRNSGKFTQQEYEDRCKSYRYAEQRIYRNAVRMRIELLGY